MSSEYAPLTNAYLHAWQVRMIGVLERVHTEQPIDNVEFSGFI